MIRAGSSPGVQRSGPVVWFLPAVATAAGVVVAALNVPADARAAVVWCGAAATLAVALIGAEVARRGKALAALGMRQAEQEAALRRRLEQYESATVRLAKDRLPEAVARLQEGEFAEDVLLSMADVGAGPHTGAHTAAGGPAGHAAGEGLSPEFQAAHEALLRSVVEAVQAEETMRDSAQRGVVNISRRVQAIVHQQAKDLREMEDRHGRQPDFFADLLRLDHGTALIGRLADSIAVLGGARPGRQWGRAVPLYSVLRGAMSRILDYQRVELHSVADIAVVGPAVEPLIHAVAELLDNATRYSPPKARVHLTAGEVHAGIAIEIEDGGVGLSEEARARAEQMLREAQRGIDLNDLGEAPRLGLAVVGRLAQAYEFQVSLSASAYGGVRAVVVVPKKLITTAPATGRAHGIGAASGPRPATAHDAAVAERTLEAATPPGTAAPPAADTPGAGPEAAPGATPAPGPRQPAAPTGRTEPEDDADAPVVTERTSTGLPQRRRRRPKAATRQGAADAPAKGDGTAAPARAASTAEEEPVPGMWMADLQSGLAGEGPRVPRPRDNNDASSNEGE